MVSRSEFRRVLSSFVSGVTVVTTADSSGRPLGLTASAFTSVSLTPPLVLVCIDHSSNTYPALLARQQFAINILHAEQAPLSQRFASNREDKFEDVAYTLSALKLPILDRAIASLECTTVNTHIEGDHTIFVGRVENTIATDGEPLVYFRGSYNRLSGGAP